MYNCNNERRRCCNVDRLRSERLAALNMMRGPAGPQGVKGDKGDSGEFLSAYVEGLGSTQDVATGGDVVFDDLDITGTGIAVNTPATTFTITRPGLYHVEWTVNLSSAAGTVLIGLTENGESTSVISSSSGEGIVSSGALIKVSTVPYVLTLRNFGGNVAIANVAGAEHTAASIRILRFADGAN